MWIDHARKKRETPDDGRDVAGAPDDPRAPREAAGTLLVRLSPQERAAVVLKDVFDFTLEEIADALSTTTAAIKIALHRGRGKLVEPEMPEARSPAPGALDAFCSAFNARDLDRLTSLLLDNVTIEVVGVHTQHGASRARDTVLTGMLFGSARMAESDKLGGIDPSYRAGVLPTPARFEIRALRGEWMLVSFYAHTDGEFVRAVTRVEIEGDRVARIRNYFFTPSFIQDVCRELGLPCRVNGYRFVPVGQPHSRGRRALAAWRPPSAVTSRKAVKSSGVVTLLARGGEVHVDAIGTRDRESGAPMERDTIFRVAPVRT